MALAVEGEGAVKAVRTLMGPTNPLEAPPGTIRGDYGLEITFNIVHGSDSPESGLRETKLFFPDSVASRPSRKEEGPRRGPLRLIPASFVSSAACAA